MADANFDGLRILSLESRRAKEIEKLILTYGGRPTVVPAMREIGLESNQQALDFAEKLLHGGFDLVVFTTGVGIRALLGIVETRFNREDFLAALRNTQIAARGPKPGSVLKELKVPIAVNAEEPNTWRELLNGIDTAYGDRLSQMRVAVQEYGASNPELLAGLSERAKQLTSVPVYQWALPEDLQPLRECILEILNGTFDVVLFMTAVQVIHLFQIAEQMQTAPQLLHALQSVVILSIGPSTTEELTRYGIVPDFEPSHPKMGFLVNEAAQSAHLLLQKKRNTSTTLS